MCERTQFGLTVKHLNRNGRYIRDLGDFDYLDYFETDYSSTNALIEALTAGTLKYEHILEIQGFVNIDFVRRKLGDDFFGDKAIILTDNGYRYIYPSMDALMTPINLFPEDDDDAYIRPIGELSFAALCDIEGPFDTDRYFSVDGLMSVGDGELRGCKHLDVNINYPTVEFGESDDHRYAFMNSTINTPIDKWKVDERAITLDAWFANSLFNQPLNNWKLTKLDDIDGIFFRSKYNHPLDKWYTKPITIYATLAFADSEFHQDLSMWKIKPDSKCDGMFYKSKYTIEEVSKWGWVKELNQPIEDLFRITEEAEESYRWLLNAIERRFR